MVQQLFPTAPKLTLGATRVASFQLVTTNYLTVTGKQNPASHQENVTKTGAAISTLASAQGGAPFT
jgi:hypothetical protein